MFAQAGSNPLHFGDALTAVLAFTFQLFLDFSAYTEMAIGTALIFGLILPENFRRPYLATNLREFWRRWHISLSNFLRDYLYIPLGGSRNGASTYIFATLCTMALCGLWHGAGWTYVVWGLWHGMGLIVCRAWQQLKRPLPPVVGWVTTFVFVMAGWVLFRSTSFMAAANLFGSLVGANGIGGGVPHDMKLLLAAAAVSVLVPSAHEMKDKLALLRLRPHPAFAGILAVLTVYCLLEVGAGAPVNFIYFRF